MKNLNKINPEEKILLSDSEMKEISGGVSDLDCRLCKNPGCLGQSCAASSRPGVCVKIDGVDGLVCNPKFP